jgi:hypothetical protein
VYKFIINKILKYYPAHLYFFKKISIGISVLLLSYCSFAQDQTYTRSKPAALISKTTELIKPDGELSETVWQKAPILKDFHQNSPFDSSYSKLKTEVQLVFDDKNIYVAAKCYQSKESIVVGGLKRDFDFGSSDMFAIILDTFNDKINGFHFSVNPYNVQTEGLISQGDDFSDFWDQVWYSGAKIYDTYWTVEMAIPFKSIRYNVSENNTWGVNFSRQGLKDIDLSSWAPIPRNFRTNNLAFVGELMWEQSPPKNSGNISLIPYLANTITKSYNREASTLVLNNTPVNYKPSAGLDAKISITPSLNLDLTFNPDFSNVEVDRQQTNLSRFELFFPERRQFFLENSDLFGTFGFPDTRPFFSRRIGIAYDPTLNQNVQVPIVAGARLSGKLNNKTRIGLLNMQTPKTNFGQDNLLPASNYTMATIQRSVFERSFISAMFVNKYSNLTNFTESQKQDFEPYNRVAGLEFNYFSKDNKLEMETYIHKSFSPNQGTDATSMAHYTGYRNPYMRINLGLLRIGEDFNASTGYVPRPGVYQIYRPINFMIYPKNPKISSYINNFNLGMYDNSDVYDLNGNALDHDSNVYVGFDTNAGGSVYTGYAWQYTNLNFSFDPTNADLNPDPIKATKGVELPTGVYRFNRYFIGFETSNRANLSANGDFTTGAFFNGNSTEIIAGVSYRLPRLGSLSLDINYNDIRLPQPYNSVDYWLVGPKVELTFTNKLFFSNFVQFNTQTNNFNLNSRLQWRFKPVSDLFLVYTDNRFATSLKPYDIDRFTPKNRALVFKMTYWLNM